MLCPRLNDSLIVDHQWVSKCWRQLRPKTLWLIIPFLAYCQPTCLFGSPYTIWCWYMLPWFPDGNLYTWVCCSWKTLAGCVLPLWALFSLVSRFSKAQTHFIGPFSSYGFRDLSFFFLYLLLPFFHLPFLFVLRGFCYVAQTNLQLKTLSLQSPESWK